MSLELEVNTLGNGKPIVQNILNKYLENQGKNIRPKLIQLFGQLFEVDADKLHHLCQAAEFLHTATLIHDDVIDNAKSRRGQPSLNQLLPNSKAILAGDFLLAQAIRELAESGNHRVLGLISKTLQEIIEGEFMQDKLKLSDATTESDLENVARLKTGSLLAWSCSSVATISNKDAQTIKLCEALGYKMGVAYQMVDDNLDFSEGTGKPFANDLEEGLLNFTSLQILKLYPELYYPIHQMRGKKSTSYPWTHEQLSKAKEVVNQHAHRQLQEVNDLLKEILEREDIDPNHENVKAIDGLITSLLERQK